MNPAIEHLEQQRHFLQAIHWVDANDRPISAVKDRFKARFLDHAIGRSHRFYSTMRGEMHQRSLENLMSLGFTTEEIQAATIAWEVDGRMIESERALRWYVNQGAMWRSSESEVIGFASLSSQNEGIDRLATPCSIATH